MNVEHGIEGLRVGVAEHDDAPTGCTVLVFETGAASAVDVRGGAPGVTGERYGFLNALSFAGGSLLGLATVAGVADAIHEQRGRGTDWLDIPAVAGGIIFDFVGEGRGWRYPDAALGATATRAAIAGSVPIGRVGAGRSATCGKLGQPGVPSGQGAASWSGAGVHVLVVTVVNAVGSIIGRDGTPVLGPDPLARLEHAESQPLGNTTLTAVVTDARINHLALAQLGRQVHSSMARAIQPFHTSTDGDVLWALTTGTSTAPVNADVLAWRASEVAWDAVLSIA
jgi:L-aminopeptidase/D-esterase-like protein